MVLLPQDAARYAANMGWDNSTSFTLFMAPHSHLLSEKGIQGPCASRMPAVCRGAFLQWVSSSAEQVLTRPAPESLDLSVRETTIDLKDFHEVDWEKGGIYDPEESRLMEILRTQGSFIQDIGYVLDQPDHLGPHSSPAQAFARYYRQLLADQIQQDPVSHLWSKFVNAWLRWGDLCSGVLGALVLCRLLFLTANVVLKCFGFQLSIYFAQHPVFQCFARILRSWREYRQVPQNEAVAPDFDPTPPRASPPPPYPLPARTNPRTIRPTPCGPTPAPRRGHTVDDTSSLSSGFPSPRRYRPFRVGNPLNSPTLTQRRARHLQQPSQTLTLHQLLRSAEDLNAEIEGSIQVANSPPVARLMTLSPNLSLDSFRDLPTTPGPRRSFRSSRAVRPRQIRGSGRAKEILTSSPEVLPPFNNSVVSD